MERYPHKSSFVQIFLKTRFEDESRDISARSRSLRAFRLAKGSVVDPGIAWGADTRH